jgi:exonuclease SbcC
MRLEHALAGVRDLIPDFRLRSTVGPESNRADALQSVTAELARCSSVLAASAADELRLEELNRDLERARARAELLDKQIGEHTAAAGQLAALLTATLTYIQSDECPVCGRDFGESSDRTLHAHVSERIAALTESSGRLQALTRERVAAANTVTAAERQRDILIGRKLEPRSRDELKTRSARLAEVQLLLTNLAGATREGQRWIDAAALAAQRLASLRNRDQRANAVRSTVVQMALQLAIAPVNETESVEVALGRIQSTVTERIESITARVTVRRVALSETLKAIELRQRRSAIEKVARQDAASLKDLENAKDKADVVIRDARELSKLAREARTETVRRVFNDSLNALWRDLFLRLAPDEPFVPAFALPDVGSTAVEATLETHHRSGSKGGNPRAMLSAGNLNTAALTLFLALHLSVEPSLPWLVIDDPVQSMDEVHVAQFAALLRTLSKSLKRQVIIAVHERPLFEYLALELNPAFPEDRLITVELGRNADGTTVMRYEPIIWTPDKAIAA